jgi:hypothetical protein
VDAAVLRAMARWPNVPEVYGWLMLDRRGQWRLRSPGSDRFERIGNQALREFISRNYACDAPGRWFFQNGPQRVFVRLAYTPLVVHFEGDAALDHCGRGFRIEQAILDEEGSVLLAGEGVVALLDDRDLERFADQAEALPRVARAQVAERFGFVPEPTPRHETKADDSLRPP